ncbi:hypothetical protein O181_004337 [Austropuccinia psidii MF-1]|uniref:Uncharacterized protein n=1 Tax=Austropuccinia psidii MF-1 TaxID=1389203 RepID=A0A9Q3GFP4_9BASI|nr:hypothetical protein [Austropuccinia psidii MF-1]
MPRAASLCSGIQTVSPRHDALCRTRLEIFTTPSSTKVETTEYQQIQAEHLVEQLRIVVARNALTLAEAFPYATPEMLQTLAEQTKTLFTHYANDRWSEFSNKASFDELCDGFDRLEREAIERVRAGAKPISITRDPKLSIPPLLLKILNDLALAYRVANERQSQKNEHVFDQISKQIQEIERLEEDVNTRLRHIKKTADDLECERGKP